MLTAPLTIFGLVWLLPAWRDARQFIVYHPAALHRSSDVELGLRQILLSRLQALRVDLASSWKARWGAPTATLPNIDLEVSPNNLARLNQNLPRSGKQGFVRGLLRYPSGRFEKVGVRYRGDSLHHWGLAAKSWLIRTAKDRAIDGQRRWHLVLPRWRSVANYHVNLRMASHMGLLAAESKLVNLRINGRQHGGVHLLQSQQDEAFLREHHRLPCDLYVGDMTPLDDNYVNEMPHGGLWELPWLWQKAAVNNKYPAESRRPLEMLLFRLNHGTTEELLELLDLPAWANFSAYMQLFAANHMEMGHNWKLLYDAGKLTFEPVVGDGNGLPDEIMQLTAAIPARDVSITTPLLARLHRDHRFLRLKNAALTGFYRQQLDRKFFAELGDFHAAVAPTLRNFPQLDWIGTVEGRPVHYFDDRDLARRLKAVTPQLTAWFALHRQNQTLRAEQLSSAVPDKTTLRLRVDGYASARIGLKLPAHFPSPKARLVIRRSDGSTQEAEVSGLFHREEDVTWLDWPLLAERDVSSPSLAHAQADHLVRPATYDVVFDNLDPALAGVIARGELGEQVVVARVPALPPAAFSASNTDILPVTAPAVHWQGRITLEGLTEIKAPLVLDPGTTLQLGPNASLIVRGRFTARGTIAQPVRIERLDPAAAWGTLAILGREADGSILEYCDISGGSGLLTPYTLFSGMVSIHNVADMQIRHCRMQDNAVFDDLLHAAYCSIKISDTIIQHAFSDGIDLDICQAQLDRITVNQTGNDALDLMTSEVTVAQSRLLHAGDKGISAGEACKVVVVDSVLSDNNVGLQAKDGTAALLYNVTLAGNKVHLSGYHKNAAYPGPARLTFAKSTATPDGLTCDLRDATTLSVLDSQIPILPANVLISRDLFSDPGPDARSADPTPAFGRLLPGPHWSGVDPRHRGSPSLIRPAARRPGPP